MKRFSYIDDFTKSIIKILKGSKCNKAGKLRVVANIKNSHINLIKMLQGVGNWKT